MANDVLFYNEIGRQGKSSLAYNYFDYLKRSGKSPRYVTNDITNISFKAKDLLGDNLQIISPSDGVEVDTDELNIFDFGGFLDSRSVDVAEYVQFIVVPVSYSSNNELTLTAKTIQALSKYNKNIVVVFNKTKTSKIRRGMEMLAQLFDVLGVDVLKVFVVSESEYMTRLADWSQSIYDVADLKKGDRTRLEKSILPQLNELFNFISE